MIVDSRHRFTVIKLSDSPVAICQTKGTQPMSFSMEKNAYANIWQSFIISLTKCILPTFFSAVTFKKTYEKVQVDNDQETEFLFCVIQTHYGLTLHYHA